MEMKLTDLSIYSKDNAKVEEKWAVFDKSKSFTPPALLKFLQDTFGMKKNGKPFVLNDVNKYIIRGHLPAYLGGKKLTVVSHDKSGIRYIVIGEEVKIK